jgi:hypothetical protein
MAEAGTARAAADIASTTAQLSAGHGPLVQPPAP